MLNRSKEANIWRLASAYRSHGHLKAHLDPLGLKVPVPAYNLSSDAFGLSKSDEHRLYKTEGILFAFPKQEASLKEVTDYLEDVYCGTLAVEPGSIRVSESLSLSSLLFLSHL